MPGTPIQQLTEHEYFAELRRLVPHSDPLNIDFTLAECVDEFSPVYISEAEKCLVELKEDMACLTTSLQAYDSLFPDGLTDRSGKPQPEPNYIVQKRTRQKTIASLQDAISRFLEPSYRDPRLEKLTYLSIMLQRGMTQVHLCVCSQLIR